MTTWVLFAGLPGTGKSTLANALAGQLDAAILDKDRVRAALFPGPLTDYSDQQDHLCMQAMLQAAIYLTQQQRSAFLFFDGRTFSTARHREEVLRGAEAAGADWRILHLQCTDAVAEARLACSNPAHPAKNRDAALYHALQQRFEPITQPALKVDTSAGFAPPLEAIAGYLRAPGPAVR